MRATTILAAQLALTAASASGVTAQAQEAAPALEARVWLDRGEEPVLQRGDQVRIYYRTSEDAYAAIFRIDTDGAIQMVYPQHPGAIEVVRGGRDFRLLLPEAPTWRVEDDPGVGYLFMVASPEPLDFSQVPYDPRIGWDLGAVSGVVYEDPYVAIDDYVALLVPDWDVVPYGLDFVTYHVGNTYAYPRFLCYDCHTRQSYSAWNPYSAVCTSFRVVIWDDPYFYPTYRYSGTRVVVARPVRALPRYELVTRAPGDIGVRPIVRARTAPERRVAEFKEAPTVDPSTRVPVRRAAPSSAQQAPARGGAARADQEDPRATRRPTLQRRPSGNLPTRTPPDASTGRAPQARGVPSGGAQARPPRGEPDRAAPTRPDARPSTPGRAGTSRPTPRREPTATPTTPSRPTPRSAPNGAPSTRPTRQPSQPSARPSAPSSRPARAVSPPSSRPSARPATPPPSRPTARPSSPPGRATARPAPTSRQPANRPTVQPRGRTRGN